MWKLNNKAIKEGKAWTDDDGVQHPANWNIWSDEEKQSAGLTYEEPVDNSFDNRFYWAKGVERSLTDIQEVDENGDAIIDPMTNEQMVTKGLKSQWIEQTKQTAQNMLSKTDWMCSRKAELGTAIPDATLTYRASIRTACNTIETAINNVSNMTKFKSLFDAPVDENGDPTGENPPIYDFPKEQ